MLGRVSQILVDQNEKPGQPSLCGPWKRSTFKSNTIPVQYTVLTDPDDIVFTEGAQDQNDTTYNDCGQYS